MSNMKVDSKKRIPGLRFLFAAASAVVVIIGLKAAETILIPFLFAMLLAVIGIAPLNWLKKHKVPNVIAVIIVAVIMVASLLFIGSLLANSANEFTARLPEYRALLGEALQSFAVWLRSHGVNVPDTFVSDAMGPDSLLTLGTTLIRGTVGALSNIVLVVVIMVLALLEATVFRKKVRTALDKSVDLVSFAQVGTDVQRYLLIKTFTSFVTGLLVGTWTWLMGIEFYLLWGLIAFILNYIPFVGSIIAAVPATMLALLTLGWWHASIVAFGYIVINIGISNFFEPILMGRRLGLSPLVVFLSLVFWGWVWGPGGMLLSVPLTMVVKILLEHSDDFRWIAVLMDVNPRQMPPEAPEEA